MDDEQAFTKVHPDWAKSNIYSSWSAYIDSVTNDNKNKDINDEKVVKKDKITGKIVVEIETDENGAPILPDYNSNMRFSEVSTIFRSYMTEHYKIETGSKSIPWKKLQDPDTVGNYINPEYLPDGAKIGDPSHMTKTSILEILDFWQGRIDSGEVFIFRFKASLGKRKGKSRSASGPEVPDIVPTSPIQHAHTSKKPETNADTTNKIPDAPKPRPKPIPTSKKPEANADTTNKIPYGPKSRPKPIPTSKRVTFLDADRDNQNPDILDPLEPTKSGTVSKHVIRNRAPHKYKSTAVHRWMYIKALADDFEFSKILNLIEELPNVQERSYEPIILPPFATWNSHFHHLPEAFHTSRKIFLIFKSWIKNSYHRPQVNGTDAPLIKQDAIDIAFSIGLVLRDLERARFTADDEIDDAPCPQFVYHSSIEPEELLNTVDSFCQDFLKAIQFSVDEHRKADKNEKDKEIKLAKLNQLRAKPNTSGPDRVYQKHTNSTREPSEPPCASSSKRTLDYDNQSSPKYPIPSGSASDVELPKPKRKKIRPDYPITELTPGKTRSATQHAKELGTRNIRSRTKK